MYKTAFLSYLDNLLSNQNRRQKQDRSYFTPRERPLMTSAFLAIFDLPTYLVLLYNVPFLGLSWTPLPTLIWDVINERSPMKMGMKPRKGPSWEYVVSFGERPLMTSDIRVGMGV